MWPNYVTGLNCESPFCFNPSFGLDVLAVGEGGGKGGGVLSVFGVLNQHFLQPTEVVSFWLSWHREPDSKTI